MVDTETVRSDEVDVHNTLAVRLLRGLIVFVSISAVYGVASFFAVASLILWGMGDGPSSRPHAGELVWLLMLLLTVGFVACQFFGLKAAVRRR